MCDLSANKDKMATVGCLEAEKMTPNPSSFEVIMLSSDEEECVQSDKDVGFLFKRFILACRPHVSKEAVKDLRKIFTEVKGNLSGSHELVNMLESYSKEVKKENAVMYLELTSRALNEARSEQESIVSTPVDFEQNENVAVDNVYTCDVEKARDFELFKKPCSSQSVSKDQSVRNLPDVSTISDDDDFVTEIPRKKHTELNKNTASTSSVHQETKSGKPKGKISIKTLTPKQRKKLAARLKQRLKEISNEIKILDRAELTLDEMEMCDSTYVREHQLKLKFENTWNKLCKVLGRPPNTGRVVEKHVRASKTGYSLIDKAVTKFLKEKRGSFPDFFDIRDVVHKTNKKHDLRMSPQVLNGLIEDIFTDIGNKMQRLREKDLLFNFGSHLLDDFKADEDPALASEELAQELENNRRISKRNLKKVYAKYTHLERYEIEDRFRKRHEEWPSMVGSSSRSPDANDDFSSDSDHELDIQQTENHKMYSRLDPRELEGKSRMITPTMQGSSQVINGDISSESSASEDEQDLPRINNEDSNHSMLIEDSDAPSSQKCSVWSTTAKPLNDLSHVYVDSSFSNTDRTESPTFPLICPVIKEDTTNLSENVQTKLTADQDCSDDVLDMSITDNISECNQTLCHNVSNEVSNTKLTFSSSSDCEIMNNPTTTQKQLVIPAIEPSVCEEQPNADEDCLIIDDTQEALTISSSKNDWHPDISPSKPVDVNCDTVNTSDNTLVPLDDDCCIVDSSQKSVTLPSLKNDEQSDILASKPAGDVKQKCETVNKPENPLLSLDNDCCIVDSNEKSVTLPSSKNDEQSDISALRPEDDVKLKCETAEKPETTSSMLDDDCCIIDSSQESVNLPSSNNYDQSDISTLKLEGEPKCETVYKPETTSSDNDCLIIENDPEDLPVPSSNNDIQSNISAPKHVALHLLESVVQPKCETVDKSETMLEDNDCLIIDSNEETCTVPSLNNDDQPPPKPEQNCTLDSLRSDFPLKCDNESGTSVSSCSQTVNSNSVQSGVYSDKLSTISSPTPSTGQCLSESNPRKRKATTELFVEVPKSTISCLEKIAIALKNKKLKLPDSWTIPKNDERKNSSTSFLSKASTSKESSTVHTSPNENNICSLSNSKAKIDLQQRQEFREKTLNALKVSTKPVSNNNNGTPDDVTTLNKTVSSICLPLSVQNGLSSKSDTEKCEVIIIDDD